MPIEHLERHGRKVTGYGQLRRKRLRETQGQVAAIISARVRDHRDTLVHLERGIAPDLQQLARALREPSATDADVRAALVSLAATATILAENADCPLHEVLDHDRPANYAPGDADTEALELVLHQTIDEHGVSTVTRCEDGSVLIRLMPVPPTDDDTVDESNVIPLQAAA